MKLEWVKDIDDPAFRNLLIKPHSYQNLIAALYDDNTLFAAGYATIDSSKIQIENPYFKTNDALSLFLSEIEKETRARKLQSSILIYPDKHEISGLLASIGWSEPEKWMVNCFFDHSFNPPWLHKDYALPPGYELKPWRELTQQQINHLKLKETQFVFPSNLSPFLYENPDADYSLCLIHHEEVIGWMMTRRVNESTISYDSFFVEKNYRAIETVLKLLAESVKRVLNSDIPYAVMEVNLMQTDTSYINFVYKRYIPFLSDYNYTNRSWKLTNS